MSNPFETKRYYICESIYKNSCTSLIPSRISIWPQSGAHESGAYIVTGPFNLTEVQIYLFNETSKLIINIQLAHRCDESGLALNKNKNGSFLTGCSSTFQNFSTAYLNNLKTTLNNGGSYKSQILSGSNPYSNFVYTDSYIGSKTGVNDWKRICQRHSDIEIMLKDFADILDSISNSPEKGQFTDKYIELIKLYNENKEIRRQLEDKLDVATNGEKYKESKEFLDSTIYVSVLWTVLATTLLFYVFKKM